MADNDKKKRQAEAARLDRQAAKAEGKAARVDDTLSQAITARLAVAEEALSAVMLLTAGLRQTAKSESRAAVEHIRQKSRCARDAVQSALSRTSEIYNSHSAGRAGNAEAAQDRAAEPKYKAEL